MGYIGDIIGNEYKSWGEPNWVGTNPKTIFISSPTGSGKTTFILNTFLPYWASQGKKLLYLVNRTILKEQLEKDVSLLALKLKEAIKIELYQTIEKEIAKIQLYTMISERKKAIQNITTGKMRQPQCSQEDSVDFHNDMHKYNEFDCVVCDEAHYFLTDSNYNTNTMYSYDFIKRSFDNKLRMVIVNKCVGVTLKHH